MTPTLDLAMELIRRPSVTPEDGGCQAVIGERLENLGFDVEPLVFGEVTNLWARHGNERPLLVCAGHTDVVPAGPLSAWTYPPFEAEISNGYLYGRGAADMKGSLAAMVTAAERFIKRNPQHRGSLGFLITSDEEGPAQDGTVRVVETLGSRGDFIDWCLIGEPTCTESLGDEIKNGRRGSLHGHLWIYGIQGHVAYPDRTINPIHRFAPALSELDTTVWDEGNQFFPPTTFQVSNIRAGTGADNVVPGELEAYFNFRYSTAVTRERLQERVESILDRHRLNYRLEWIPGGEPFLTEGGALVDALRDAVQDVCTIEAKLSTSGGTSDGRFVAPAGAEVAELGPVNGTIHKVDECVRVEDLDTLSQIYERVLERLLRA